MHPSLPLFGASKRNCIKYYYNYSINTMNRQFETTLKRKAHRQRFYSSMTHEEYCEVYGPPSPKFKPQDDPIEDLPLLDLELTPSSEEKGQEEPVTTSTLQRLRMDTILQIEGSENFTQNLQFSPRVQLFPSQSRLRDEEESAPKRMRVRMRSQSDNSEYLIFNFLERANEKGRKRVKLDE